MDKLSKYHDHEYIEAYIMGRLSDNEKKEFEAALTQDPELQKKLENEQFLIQGIEHQSKSRLKAHFQALEEQEKNKSGKAAGPSLSVGLKIAAALIILLVPIYFLFIWEESNNYEEIYSAHFTAYPVLQEGTVRGEKDAGLKSKGLEEYQNGNYSGAIESLSSYLSKNEDAVTRFYLGISYLANEEPDLARSTLKELPTSAEFRFSEQAKWYRGLASLRSGETSEAVKLFEELKRDTNDPNIREKCRKILKDL